MFRFLNRQAGVSPLAVALAAAVAILVSGSEPARAAAAPVDDQWHLNVALGLWATSLVGDVGTANVQSDVDICFTDLAERLDFGAMGGVSLNKGDLLLLFNGMYVMLGDDLTLGDGRGGSLDVDLGIADLALGYTLVREPTAHGRDITFTPAVGVRYTSLSLDVTPNQFPTLEENQSWWDPYIGVMFVVPLSRTLDLRTTGSIGGWGVGSDLTWSLEAFLDWRFSDKASLNVGYRALSWDYDKHNLVWDTTLHGPWVGVTFLLF